MGSCAQCVHICFPTGLLLGIGVYVDCPVPVLRLSQLFQHGTSHNATLSVRYYGVPLPFRGVAGGGTLSLLPSASPAAPPPSAPPAGGATVVRWQAYGSSDCERRAVPLQPKRWIYHTLRWICVPCSLRQISVVMYKPHSVSCDVRRVPPHRWVPQPGKRRRRHRTSVLERRQYVDHHRLAHILGPGRGYDRATHD